MSATNYYYYHKDTEVLKDYAEQYESMGRSTKIEGNRLTVFARTPAPAPVKKKFERKPKDDDRPRRRD